MPSRDAATDSAPELDSFVRTFREVLERILHGSLGSEDSELIRRLREHLGDDPTALPVSEGRWEPFDLVNVHRGLEACLSRAGRSFELVGVGSSFGPDEGLATLVDAARRHGAATLGPVRRQVVATSATSSEEVVSSGLYLAVVDGVPLAALLSDANPRFGRDKVSIGVMCGSPDTAASLLDEVREEAVRRNVFRGQVVSFSASGFDHEIGPLRFHQRPNLARGDLVLPDGVLEVVERQVIGIAAHRDALRDAGQHLKRGVLLHGPPGTGKTHTVRYLLSRLTGVTVVLLSGLGLRFVGPACALARQLQPAVVVLEDCDLVAEDRSFSMGPQPLLFDVLNELDGLGEDVDVAFLLTTNRADLLEPALAARPGRVDQAVEVPLPDAGARQELFRLYTRGLTLAADVDLGSVAERTAGVTASLLKELARRATLHALAESPAAQPAEPAAARRPFTVTGAHVAAALDELDQGASELTRRLLGHLDEDAVVETIEPLLGDDWGGPLPPRARVGRGYPAPGLGM